jgi:hypothetical protein
VSERIHVYYLENGDAEEISQTLSSLTSGQAGARGARIDAVAIGAVRRTRRRSSKAT